MFKPLDTLNRAGAPGGSSSRLREDAAVDDPFPTGAPAPSSNLPCESCEQVPAAVWLYGFAVCGCANAGLNP